MMGVLYDHLHHVVNPCLTNMKNRPFTTTALTLLFPACFALSGCFLSHSPKGSGDVSHGAVVIPIATSSHPTDAPSAVPEDGVAGRVLRVTTLAPDGDGSLRRALLEDGPRLIVFEVGGVIDLGGRTLVVRNPHLTIAGQTAPDPGITLIRGGLVVETHDVVIQHLTVRPGDSGPPGQEWAPDAMGVRGAAAHDVLFEHCSATWAIDENLSTSGPADTEVPGLTSHDITFRYCLIAEGLSNATHPKGEHSKGTLVHDGVRNVRIEGCLYAHNRERNPRLKGGTTTTVLDSVMYNWGSGCVGIGARGNQKVLTPAVVTLAGNVAIAGPDTRSRTFVKGLDPGGRALLGDNLALTAKGDALAMADANVVVEKSTIASDPRAAAERALRRAGSRAAKRDPIDARIVQSVIRGDGRIIDSQNEVGGYPKYEATSRALKVPEDVETRRRWLQKLSDELAVDRSLDVAPLWKRLAK